MTKFIAKLGIFSATIALTFANYWFTFGLWPKSWLSFFLCAIALVVLLALGIVVEQEAA